MGIIRETAEMSVTERMAARNSNFEYIINDFLSVIYPIGSIYISTVSTSPSTLFGGTWERIKDRFLLAAGDTYTLGATGGEAEHTLMANEMPTHRHPMFACSESASETASGTDYVGDRAVYLNYTSDSRKTYWQQLFQAEIGGNQPHNNMPPYLAVYVWKRTA